MPYSLLHIPQATFPEKQEIAEALLCTVETIVQQAAEVVETKTQILTEQITEMMNVSQLQEKTIAHLFDCVQHIYLQNEPVSWEDYLKQMQATLAFSVEHNLSINRSLTAWENDLDDACSTLEDMALELDHLKQTNEHLKHILNECAGNFHQTRKYLQRMKEHMCHSKKDAIEIKLFQNDAALMEDLISQQPNRALQLQIFIQQAHASAHQMIDAGRAAIIAIQFQDYNSQIAQNAVRLLQCFRSTLAADSDSASTENLFEECFKSMTLEEVRNIFLQHFPNISLPEASAADSVELF